jgi:hypothetical protein
MLYLLRVAFFYIWEFLIFTEYTWDIQFVKHRFDVNTTTLNALYASENKPLLDPLDPLLQLNWRKTLFSTFSITS